MKIGVRVHDFGKSDAKTLAKQAKEIGFDAVQFVINKAIDGESGAAGTLNDEKVNSFYEAFNNEGIEICLLGAYFNPVHSNKELVAKNIAKFKEHLLFENKFHARAVGTETGSYNDDKWTYNPLNRTEEAYLENVRIFKDIAKYAEEVKSNFALEGAYAHCMHSPQMLKKLSDEINSSNQYFIVDVYNYLAYDNYDKQIEIFDECLELFKDRIIIFHIKDFIVDEENQKLVQCCIGKGIMNYDYMIPKMKESCPNAVLVFEGSKPQDMQFSYNFIKEKLGE